MAENINKRIVTALQPFGLEIAESLYEGDADEYFFYAITLDKVGDSGDDVPQAYVADVQIHYVCPFEKSYADMLKQIRRALIDADFVGLSVVDRSEVKERIRHLVIECETEDEYAMEG